MNSFFVKEKSFYKTFLLLAGALALEQAVILSVNLADNIMLGGYSETSLSGVAAVNQIQFFIQQVVYGISNGLIVLAAQYWGQRHTEPIRRLVSLGLRPELVFAMAAFLLVSFFPRQSVGFFVRDAAVIEEGVRYLEIIRFTYPFFAVTAVLLGAMRSVETVRVALKVSAVSLAVNCGINFVLIRGRFGAPELGVQGAAVGTLTARILECAVVGYYVLVRDRKLNLRPGSFLFLDRALGKDYLRTGTPIILQAAMWGAANMIQTAVLGHMTANAMAAYSITSAMFLLLKAAAVGACTAASILIGKQVGAGTRETLKQYVHTMQAVFAGIGLVLGVSLYLMHFPLLGLYNISAETRRLTEAFFLIQSVVICTMSYQMPVNSGIIRGGGDTKFSMILDMISLWGVVLPLSCLAAFVWGWSPVAVVICLNSDQIFKCVPAAIHVNSYRWVKKLTREQG